ncbi:MAG: 3'-5' exonuclease, partial [Verrucomicrobiota bacterium]
MKIRERIIALAQSENYAPLDKYELTKELGLGKRDQRKLDHELRLLVSKGELIKIKGQKYCIPHDADLVPGTIKFRQTGSAIVIPNEDPRNPNASPIDIDAEDTSVAMHEDKVVVRLYDEHHRPRESPWKRK